MQSQAKSPKDRVKSYRSRMRAAGLKPVQIWVPDANSCDFAEECRRQSRIIRNDPLETRDLELLADLADWGHE
ncbi:Protein of unknown function [Geoalkalibacter ferrihydriticus]|uniref:Antitoxin MazE n=1 Tax=Geoalkalibacter ferrihydriticus TaxID=392333 RepID=A0A1G9X9V4_9BACT|nr:antitoxin MazE family protein [Geoalkalibacter ferrihydriticus]SDM93095.1 Protein of unknown function [Geoalkalibacter ferrihydriticus]